MAKTHTRMDKHTHRAEDKALPGSNANRVKIIWLRASARGQLVFRLRPAKYQQAAPPCCLPHSSLSYFLSLSLFLLSHTLEGGTKAPTRFSTFQSRQSPTHPYSSHFYNTCSGTEGTTMLDQGSFHPGSLQTLIHSPCVLSDNRPRWSVWSVIQHKIVCVDLYHIYVRVLYLMTVLKG